jgi:hypothetical protein
MDIERSKPISRTPSVASTEIILQHRQTHIFKKFKFFCVLLKIIIFNVVDCFDALISKIIFKK